MARTQIALKRGIKQGRLAGGAKWTKEMNKVVIESYFCRQNTDKNGIALRGHQTRDV